MSTAASGDFRLLRASMHSRSSQGPLALLHHLRAGQPGRQLRASMHSRSSQGPPGSEELQAPHQMQPGCILPAPDRRRLETGRLCSLPRQRRLTQRRPERRLRHQRSGSA
ncbi:hypothetical protein CVIRNUC_010731 [Coccomyxa viridis]|uniref:Uncharacterized protein n=1 Tax=Coccomyxa viridis TaxID=1274662 RepID=A0AAV1IL11_9CHLO|nr:hypothetical protein CVIRNUC_010731 [Coccomyxa viridis]